MILYCGAIWIFYRGAIGSYITAQFDSKLRRNSIVYCSAPWSRHVTPRRMTAKPPIAGTARSGSGSRAGIIHVLSRVHVRTPVVIIITVHRLLLLLLFLLLSSLS